MIFHNNKNEQPNQCCATPIISVYFISKVAFYINNVDKKNAKKNSQRRL